MTAEHGGHVNLQDRGHGNLRVLHTCPQTSTDKFLNNAVVENVYAAIRSEMPHGIVLGAGSRRNDRERARHSGRVWVLQMPLRAAVPIIFGPLNWVEGDSPCRIGIVFAAHRAPRRLGHSLRNGNYKGCGESGAWVPRTEHYLHLNILKPPGAVKSTMRDSVIGAVVAVAFSSNFFTRNEFA